MADLGNLFFSLGLDTKQIDSAWDKALKKYGQKAQVDLKLNTGDLKAIKAQYAELNAKNKLAQDNEQRGKMNALKLTREQLKTEELINTQKARTASVQDRSTAAIHRTNSALTTQNRLVQNLHTMAASYISIFAGARLVRELVTITGEFESQKIALQAILGDLNGANAIFEQIKQLSVKSPFQFKDLISYTKQLSAFSIPINELYDTTKMLADVSAGLGVGMDRLVLAYGQIRAASVLRGQEVRQLTEAGIPVIEALRKKFEELGETGITAADVFDKISARLVPFSMIKDMFTDMTSEGGKFFKMQEIQAETLKGKVSNLVDAYQIMMAEIGGKSEGVLKGAVDSTRYLMANYEQFGKTIMELVVAYGVYKGAIITHNILLAIQTKYGLYDIATKKLQVAATLQNVAATKALNAVMAVNPYVATALAVTALTYGLYKLATNQTNYQKGLEKLTDAKSDAVAESLKEEYELTKLYDKLKNAAEGTKEYYEAKDAIQRKYGSYLEGLKNEKGEVVKLADAYQYLSDKIKESAFQRGYQTYMDEATQSFSTTLAEQIVKMDETIQKAITRKILTPKEGAILSGEVNKLLKGELQFQELTQQGRVLFFKLQREYNGAVESTTRKATEARINMARLSEQAKRLFSTQTFVDGGDAPAKPSWMSGDKWLNDLGKYATKYSSAMQGALLPKDDESAEDFLSRLKDDYKETADSIAVNSQLAGKDVTDLKDRLAALSGAFKVLGISPIEAKGGGKKDDKQKEIDLLAAAQEKLADMEMKLYLNLEDAKVQSMADGWEKEVVQLQTNHRKRLIEIERQQRELLEAQAKAGGSGTILTPTNAAVIGGLSQEATNQYNSSEAALYKSVLEKYKSFEQRRLDIASFYVAEEKRIKAASYGKTFEEYEAYMAEMRKAREKDLKELEDDVLNTTIASSSFLQKVFGDIGLMTKRQLKQNIADAKQLLNYITRSEGATLPSGVKPEDVEKMVGDYKAIAKLQKIIAESQNKNLDLGNTPLGGFIEGFSLLKLAAAETATAVKESGTQIGIDAERAAESFKGMAATAIIGAAVQLADMLGSVADRMTEVAEATGNMKMKEFAAQMKDVSGFFSDVGKGFKEGGWIGAVIAAVFSAVTKTIDAFQQAKLQDAVFKQDQLNWTREYQNTLLKLNENDYESIFGVAVLSKSVDAYKNAVKALRGYKDELSKRTAPETEKERKATGIATFFGFGGGMNAVITKESELALSAYKKGLTDIQRMAVKTKDQTGWANFFGAKDQYKSLFSLAPELWGGEMGGDFNIEAAKVFLETNTQITDEQRKQIQNLITQKELYDENVNIIKEDLQNTFGGLGDSLLDALQNAIETGADSFDMFEDAGSDAIEKLGRKLIYEIFLAERFKKFQDDLAATYKDEKLDTPEKIATAQLTLMDEFYNGVERDWDKMTEFNKRWQEQAAARGFNIYSGDKTASLGGSIQAAQLTENTGNLIGSYINAMRADGSKRTMIAEKMLPIMSNINDTMGNGLAHLAAISSNTMRSANNTDAIVEKLNALTSPNGATRLNAVIKTS